MKTSSEIKLDALKKAKKKLDSQNNNTSSVSEKVDKLCETLSEYIKSDNISLSEYTDPLRISIEENDDFLNANYYLNLAIRNTNTKIEEELAEKEK